jgi:hypothetical protein
MATKPQAKAAIDSAATAVKADIDNILPVGVNISDGKIEFGPMKWYIKLLAADATTAEAWTATMEANLAAAGRQFRTRREGFYVDTEKENVITIATTLAIYQITGF